MNPFQRLEQKKTYSRRSQSSWREQWRLEADLKRCAAMISISEGNVAKLEDTVKRLTEAMLKGQPVFPGNLGDASRELDDEKRRLAEFRKHTARLQARIKELMRPTRSQADERRRQQIQLGKLAAIRLEKDRAIARNIDALLRLLPEREELTAKMRAAASAIDLKGGPDFLDEARFVSLRDALPSDLLAESAARSAWLAGQERGKKPYTVSESTLTLEETLADCHCYRRGDTVHLTEEQATHLLASHSVESPDGPESDRQEKKPGLAVVRGEVA
jgi:predicted transcriptional regulator